MHNYFIEFRDPLFSIILFFVIIFIVAFFSYWWSKYTNRAQSASLDAFLHQFGVAPSKDELHHLIAQGELSEKAWLLLASAYFKSGDYEKSIDIYKMMLQLGNTNAKETMFLLGKTYFKAGFLERSRHIFVEILKKHPHTSQALHYLLLVYESMRNYKSALDVLDSLDALEEDIELEQSYLSALMLLEQTQLNVEEKTERLLALYGSSHALTRLIFEYLFRVDVKLAWSHFDFSKSELMSDIFWYLPSKDLDFDIIAKNGFLRELYTARGVCSLESASAIFEFDLLIKLQNRSNATLTFEYLCTHCKTVYPFAFHRCTNCHTIASLQVEYRVSQDRFKELYEENNSFQ
jgi:lipopolysaccharide assembly protein B